MGQCKRLARRLKELRDRAYISTGDPEGIIDVVESLLTSDYLSAIGTSRAELLRLAHLNLSGCI